jgi:hypothetical protein
MNTLTFSPTVSVVRERAAALADRSTTAFFACAALIVASVATSIASAPDLAAQQPRTRAAAPARGAAKSTARSTAKSTARGAARGVTKGMTKGAAVKNPNAGTKAANVAGTWISPEWGEMNLTQTGNKIRGTYNHQSGRVEGTVRGNTVDMNWWEPSPDDRDYDRTIHPERGQARFTLKPQDGAMNGTWRYERTLDPRPDGEWNLRKVVTAQAPATAKTGANVAGKTGTRTTGKATGRAPARTSPSRTGSTTTRPMARR